MSNQDLWAKFCYIIFFVSQSDIYIYIYIFKCIHIYIHRDSPMIAHIHIIIVSMIATRVGQLDLSSEMAEAVLFFSSATGERLRSERGLFKSLNIPQNKDIYKILAICDRLTYNT